MAITRTTAGIPETATFLYSGDGIRVKKVGLTKTIRYVGGFGDQVTATGAVQLKHIFVGGLRVAIRRTGDSATGTYPSTGSGQASPMGIIWAA